MSNSNDGSVNNRLEQSNYGAPKINPDEQRKYLGTFRERVSFVIQIKDLANPDAIAAFKKEIQKNPEFQLIVNGQANQSKIGSYMKIAGDNNIQFVIKTDSFYRNDPDSYGIVYAAKKAINQSPIDWQQKYPTNDQSKTEGNHSNDHQSLWDKIKKLF